MIHVKDPLYKCNIGNAHPDISTIKRKAKKDERFAKRRFLSIEKEQSRRLQFIWIDPRNFDFQPSLLRQRQLQRDQMAIQ